MILAKTKRPGNLDVTRAAAILCGDWGTSAEYAKGLAFAIAGYISFWLRAAMRLLTVLVGVITFEISQVFCRMRSISSSMLKTRE
jgi:hypothetical protein